MPRSDGPQSSAATLRGSTVARGVTVARLILDQLVLVRIQAGQRSSSAVAFGAPDHTRVTPTASIVTGRPLLLTSSTRVPRRTGPVVPSDEDRAVLSRVLPTGRSCRARTPRHDTRTLPHAGHVRAMIANRRACTFFTTRRAPRACAVEVESSNDPAGRMGPRTPSRVSDASSSGTAVHASGPHDARVAGTVDRACVDAVGAAGVPRQRRAGRRRRRQPRRVRAEARPSRSIGGSARRCRAAPLPASSPPLQVTGIDLDHVNGSLGSSTEATSGCGRVDPERSSDDLGAPVPRAIHRAEGDVSIAVRLRRARERRIGLVEILGRIGAHAGTTPRDGVPVHPRTGVGGSREGRS